MTPFVTAGAGFLLAVLWFDLMFDVQVWRRRNPTEEAVESIATYYRRVTLAARPMNRLVAIVMLGTLVALGFQVADDDTPRWAAAGSLGLVLAATGLAASRTFRRAVRLGTRRDPPPVQAALARLMLRDHVLCLAAIAALLVIQLGFAGCGGEDEPSQPAEATARDYLAALQAEDTSRVCELYSDDYRELVEDESDRPCEDAGLGSVDDRNELLRLDENGNRATAVVSCEDSTASDCSLPLVAESGEWKIAGSLSPND